MSEGDTGCLVYCQNLDLRDAARKGRARLRQDVTPHLLCTSNMKIPLSKLLLTCWERKTRLLKFDIISSWDFITPSRADFSNRSRRKINKRGANEGNQPYYGGKLFQVIFHTGTKSKLERGLLSTIQALSLYWSHIIYISQMWILAFSLRTRKISMIYSFQIKNRR